MIIVQIEKKKKKLRHDDISNSKNNDIRSIVFFFSYNFINSKKLFKSKTIFCVYLFFSFNLFELMNFVILFDRVKSLKINKKQ